MAATTLQLQLVTLRPESARKNKDDAQMSKELGLQRQATTLSEFDTAGHGWLSRSETLDEIADENDRPNTMLGLGWPQVPQLFQKHSWNFAMTLSPSVHKAASHLELLQCLIDDWVKEFKSRSTSRVSLSDVQTVPYNTVRDSLLMSGQKRPLTFESEEQHGPVNGSLSVIGVGATPLESNVRINDTTTSSAEPEIPYLGARDVLEEVVVLLAKLELDRQELISSLKEEKLKAKRLSDKIDELCLWKLRQIGYLSQKEHERCAEDLSELRWHIAYHSRNYTRIRARKEVAEKLHLEFQSELTEISSRIPFVTEKLEMELLALNKIAAAQYETDMELAEATKTCNKVEVKYTDANNLADAERAVIKEHLDSIRNDIAKTLEELNQSIQTHVDNMKRCEFLYKKQEENTLAIAKARKDLEHIIDMEKTLEIRVREMEKSIGEEMYKSQSRELELSTLKTAHETNKISFAQAETDMEYTNQKTDDELKKRTRAALELQMDVETATKVIADCEKQKGIDERNIARMQRESESTQLQIAGLLEEISVLVMTNATLYQRVQQVESEYYKAEEKMKDLIESLKKQQRDEIQLKMNLQAQLINIAKEKIEVKAKGEEKIDICTKKLKEIDAALAVITEKSRVLQEAFKKKSQALNDQQEALKKLQAAKENLEKKLTGEINELTPQHQQIKGQHTELTKKLDYMATRSEQLQREISDMHSSSSIMLKKCDKSKLEIANLEEKLCALRLKADTERSCQEKLRNAIYLITDRQRNREKEHKYLMAERLAVKEEQDNHLAGNLQLNTNLASRYRQLRNRAVTRQIEFLDQMDQKMALQNKLKDLQQVIVLQTRMQTALNDVYRLHEEFTATQFSSLGSQSSDSGTKISELQDQFENALSSITDFLSSTVNSVPTKSSSDHLPSLTSKKSVVNVSAVPNAINPTNSKPSLRVT